MQEDIMTKDEFLYALRRALSGEISPSDFDENMRYYEEYIETEIRKGRSEREVMESLGDPRLIAKTIKETSSPERVEGYASYSQESSGENNSGQREKKRNGKIRIYGGWKAILALVIILLLIVLVLVVILKAIGAILYFMGPLLVVAILIWLIQMRD